MEYIEYLASLIPYFPDIWTHGVHVTKSISAIFVLFLVLSLVGALLYILTKAYRTYRSLEKAQAVLSEISGGNVAEKRRSISARMSNIPRIKGVWRQWNETLVEGENGKRLFATVDTSQFFNSRAIAPDLVDNRFLSAVPGLLTAVGVFGTFLGLTFGLSGLDLSGGGMERIATDVNRMISGASLAFLTSVWGVGSSIIFNIIEKATERNLRKRVRILRNEVIELFPCANTEDTLLLIEQHSRQARETMQGLAEQIGNRMQESVAEMGTQMTQAVSSLSESMVKSVADILSPALEQLLGKADEFADRQTSGVYEALSDLVEHFTGVLGQRASEQSKAMDDAANEMRNQLSEFSNHLKNMSDAIDHKFKESSTQDEERSKKINELISDLLIHHKKLFNSVENGVKSNNEATSAIQSQAYNLVLEVEKIQKTMKETTEELKAAVSGFNQATENIKELIATLGRSSDQMASALRDAGQATLGATNISNQVSENLEQSLTMVRETQQQIEETRNGIKEASDAVVNGMTSAIDLNGEMQEKLKRHVEQLQKQVSDMLADYSSQVSTQTKDRLEEWNRQTREFCQAMYNVVSQINGIIGDIEDMKAVQ